MTVLEIENYEESKELQRLLPKNKEILFLCIGTDRSTGDSLGPIVGSKLKEKGYLVLGTLDNPVHAVNLEATVGLIKEKYSEHFVIAIDASLGRVSGVGRITIDNKPLKPGAGVNKELPSAGNICIKGTVNVSGFMEIFVLQNTRLSIVMDMADRIVDICEKALRKRKREGKATMKYAEAQEQLRKAVKTQKTIQTSKLNEILQAMNISLKEGKQNSEVDFLKSEIKKLKGALKQYESINR